MPRKTRRVVPPSSTAPLKAGASGYVLTGLLCAALGSGGTYLALRPALAQASQNKIQTAQADREPEPDEDVGGGGEADAAPLSLGNGGFAPTRRIRTHHREVRAKAEGAS